MICQLAEFLSASECEELRALFPPARPGLVAAGSGRVREHAIRRSNITFLDPAQAAHPIAEKIRATILRANAEVYHYEIVGTEAFQLAEYVVGGGYGWHMDLGSLGTACRKLSATVQLSAPEEYEGGALEFFSGTIGGNGLRTRGSITIFPAYLLHRVAPVTKGVRRSVVAWAGGSSPFK